MNCFAEMLAALDQTQVSYARTKTKPRKRCSMLVFKCYEKCKCEGAESKVREVWRGCNGYRQHGLDICSVHARSLKRQQQRNENAATLIQSIVRRNRAKKLVVGRLNTFGRGEHRDVVMSILDDVRNLHLDPPHPKRSKQVRDPPLNLGLKGSR